MFWSLEEWQGKNGGTKDKKEKRTGMCVEEKKRGKKRKKKRKKCRVWRIKKEREKRKKEE